VSPLYGFSLDSPPLQRGGCRSDIVIVDKRFARSLSLMRNENELTDMTNEGDGRSEETRFVKLTIFLEGVTCQPLSRNN